MPVIPKLTLKELKDEFNKVHHHKYGYDLVVLGNRKIKVKIYCPVHDYIFEQQPRLHLKGGTACDQCASEETSRINGELFIIKAKEVHKYDYSLFLYVNAATKGTIICPIHDTFKQTPNDHTGIKQHGCPECGRIKSVENRKNVIFIKKQNGEPECDKPDP